MAQGVPTPEETVARFRAHYLYSGNAAESARAVGIPETTGRDLARRLSHEPDFALARRELRAQALEELIAMRSRVAQTALARFEGDLPVPDVGADGMVTVIDKRADYGKLVLESEKNAHNLAKIEAEREGSPDRSPVEVHVHLKPEGQDKGDGGGSGSPAASS
jgi:phage terminase small subunit